MVNTRGGKGYKKGKTNRVRDKPNRAIESVDVDAGEGFYARIIKRLGGKPAQFEVTLSNGTTDTIISRGRMHKKQWINPGMLVLVNNGKEIIKIVREVDNDAKDANKIMNKVENNDKNVFCTFFNDESSDDDIDLNQMSSDSDESIHKKLNLPNNKKLNFVEKKKNNESEESEDEEDEENENEDENEEDEENENEDENEEDEENENEDENEDEDEDEKENNKYKIQPQKKDKRNKKNFDRNKNNHGDFNVDDI
jgi:hypothetical protein